MGDNSWAYFIMTIVILHVVAGFVYLMYKMSPKNGDDDAKDSSKDS